MKNGKVKKKRKKELLYCDNELEIATLKKTVP